MHKLNDIIAGITIRGLTTASEVHSLNSQPKAYSSFRVRLRLTVKRNTVQLFIVAGTFHVLQPQEEQFFRSLADGTRSVPATF